MQLREIFLEPLKKKLHFRKFILSISMKIYLLRSFLMKLPFRQCKSQNLCFQGLCLESPGFNNHGKNNKIPSTKGCCTHIFRQYILQSDLYCYAYLKTVYIAKWPLLLPLQLILSVYMCHVNTSPSHIMTLTWLIKYLLGQTHAHFIAPRGLHDTSICNTF